ncbi:MAG: heme ABC exporter ATP-binding protein CcmA [Chloroflexota bacterium]|nr:heme ABC exporter ATP-binding protein CcmA [Chloroflexota bacterium]MDE2885624.1 heme ABC exporter ATP-binding protein CcmA [Chloroflexota bacterium]
MTEQSAPTTPRSGHALELRGVSKTYGSTHALRNVDLDAAWGRVLVLFGHNGAGKSTLLRVAAALIKPTAGSVATAGFDADGHAGRVRAATGYAGHGTLLYDDLTPEENLRFYARLYGVARPEERAAEVLRDVGAERWAQRRVRGLSNGMQKRVAIARALLHRPALLLLDEPYAGLDVQGRGFVDAVVRAVAAGGGAVVLSAHDPALAFALDGDFAVLRGGRLAATGEAAGATPDEIAALLSAPAEAA